MLTDALTLAAWEGREAVFQEIDGASFAVEAKPLVFQEQVDYLRQKRPKPSKTWLDAMHGDHDRDFVIAGVTDIAMLEDFQAAIIDAVTRGRSVDDFAKDFDRLVEKYGWDYRGDRNWRIKTIFETNIRTSFMAGRLRQMRDPELVRLRPFWEYLHGDIRTPKVPRPDHVAWNGLILRWDDPWWNTHFPPNDWVCSCGVRTLAARNLASRGKTGPDPAPKDVLIPSIDPSTGQMAMRPRGIGWGWAHAPGDLWERGLVPSALIEEGGGLIHEGRHIVQIDTPSPLADLQAKAKPFVAKPLPPGLTEEEYVKAFLEPFGAEPGKAVLFTDAAGHAMPISDELFRARDGQLKVSKRGRDRFTPLMAEVLMDPDEIWIGVAAKRDPVDPTVTEFVLDRRYIRVDPENGFLAVFEVGRRWWDAITIYNPTDKKGRPDFTLLNRRRGGKLIWRRK